DDSVVGRSVQMSGQLYTIVGVMPASFRFTPDADVFVPSSKSEDWSDQAVVSLITGRLRPSVTLQVAQQELNVIEQRLREEHPEAALNSELGIIFRLSFYGQSYTYTVIFKAPCRID